MTAARTAAARQIQYHAAINGAKALQAQIERYICGTSGRPKTKPVTEYQIIKYFRATTPDFVRRQLQSLIESGRIYKPTNLYKGPAQ